MASSLRFASQTPRMSACTSSCSTASMLATPRARRKSLEQTRLGGALGALTLTLYRFAGLQLDADAVRDRACDHGADEDEHAVDPDLERVGQTEEDVRTVGGAGDEDEQDPRRHADADRGSHRCVARPV